MKTQCLQPSQADINNQISIYVYGSKGTVHAHKHIYIQHIKLWESYKHKIYINNILYSTVFGRCCRSRRRHYHSLSKQCKTFQKRKRMRKKYHSNKLISAAYTIYGHKANTFSCCCRYCCCCYGSCFIANIWFNELSMGANFVNKSQTRPG